MSYVASREDRVKRPDHYHCLSCGQRFNDAKFKKEKIQGIFAAQAICPFCESTNLKISWWRKKRT